MGSIDGGNGHNSIFPSIYHFYAERGREPSVYVWGYGLLGLGAAWCSVFFEPEVVGAARDHGRNHSLVPSNIYHF